MGQAFYSLIFILNIACSTVRPIEDSTKPSVYLVLGNPQHQSPGRGSVCLLIQSRPILHNPLDCSPPGSSLWDFPDKNIGVGCHFLLQGIFLTQGLNSPSPVLQENSLPILSHYGSSEDQQENTIKVCRSKPVYNHE